VLRRIALRSLRVTFERAGRDHPAQVRAVWDPRIEDYRLKVGSRPQAAR
jgi:hypothetical protein